MDISVLDSILQQYKKEEASLIPALQKIQEIFGYLPEEALNIVSRILRIPLSRIYGVATFYSQFYLNARGRHTVRVCRGTACHVRGGKHVLQAVKGSLGIEEGCTTPDSNFTFETVACLGACALSPVMVVDKTYYAKMTPAKVERVLKNYTAKRSGDEA